MTIRKMKMNDERAKRRKEKNIFFIFHPCFLRFFVKRMFLIKDLRVWEIVFLRFHLFSVHPFVRCIKK